MRIAGAAAPPSEEHTVKLVACLESERLKNSIRRGGTGGGEHKPKANRHISRDRDHCITHYSVDDPLPI